MFSGFGQGGFAVLGQALESLGQIVAPIEDEEGLNRSANSEISHESSHGDEDEDEDEESGFDSHIRKFIEQRRKEIEAPEDRNGEHRHTKEPPSPTSSLVDVALDDDSIDRSHILATTSSVSSMDDRKSYNSSPSDYSNNSGIFLANNELEKQVQKKYREQLEREIKSFDHRYHQLELQTDRTISILQAECENWKQKALSHRDQALTCGNCERLNDQYTELQTEQSILVEANRGLSAMLAESEQQNRQLTEQLTSLKDMILMKTKEIQDLEEIQKTLSEQLSTERQQHQLQQTKGDQESVQRIADLAAEMQALQQKQSQNQQHFDTERLHLQSTIDKLTADNQRLQGHVQQVESKWKDCEERCRQLQAELTASRQHSHTAEQSHQQQVEDLRQQIRQVTQDHHTNYQKLESQYHLQVQKGEDIQKSYDALTQQHQVLLNESTLAEQRLKNLEKELVRCKESSESNAVKESNVMEQELEALHRSHDALALDKTMLEQDVAQGKLLLLKAEQEIQRLNDVWLETEERLKATEEVAWQNKAEAGELLWAYETNQAKLQEVQQAYDQLQQSTSRDLQAHQSQLEGSIQLLSKVFNRMQRFLGYVSDPNHQYVDVQWTYDDMVQQEPQVLSTFQQTVTQLHDGVQSAKQRESQLLGIIQQQVISKLVEGLQLPPPHSSNGATSSTVDQTAVDVVQQVLQLHQDVKKQLQDQAQASQQLQLQCNQSKAAITSLEEKLVHVNKLNSELTKDLEHKRNDLKQLQDHQHSNSRQLQDSLQEVKAALLKAENDNKNLQVVISQLRQAGRAKTGETESIQQELQSLRQQNMTLLKEVEDSKRLLKEYERYPEVLQERNQFSNQIKGLEMTISDMKRTIAILEKDVYGKTTGYEIIQSEQRMLKQELQQKQEEIQNIQDVMIQMQSEHRYELNHYKTLVHELQHKQDEVQLQQSQQQQQVLQEQIEALQQEVQLQRQQCEDQALLRRQAEIAFHQEKKKMQSILENALKQLQNSSHDVVDRMLIANLIVSYFKRRRSREVMELIAKVLCFDDDQLVVVGLKVPPINIFSSLVNTVLGSTPTPVAVEGDNLAELWVNFLINQTEDGDGKKPQSLKPSQDP